MSEDGMMMKAACLATTYLMYAGSLANTRYIRTVKDAKAVAINIVNESLNKVFMVLILQELPSELGSIGLVKSYTIVVFSGIYLQA